jgi:hypothetical protein
MSIERPAQGSGKREPVGLDSVATHLLEECRMVLPGIQALFGFQLMVVFNEGFSRGLSPEKQRLHLAAIVLVAVSVAIVMAPAAVHRCTQQRDVSERFVWLSSRLLRASMLPLAAAVCLDLFLIAGRIVDDDRVAWVVAAAQALVFAGLWVALPWSEARRQA